MSCVDGIMKAYKGAPGLENEVKSKGEELEKDEAEETRCPTSLSFYRGMARLCS